MSQPTDWYAPAPKGSPDNYVTTKHTCWTWSNPPAWIHDILCKGIFQHAHGVIRCKVVDGVPTIFSIIYTGFYFDVSVVGGNDKTLPAALNHDLIYSLADAMAEFYNVGVRTILHIADRFFLAVMDKSGWMLKRSYFLVVRTFGYGFNRLGKWLRGEPTT